MTRAKLILVAAALTVLTPPSRNAAAQSVAPPVESQAIDVTGSIATDPADAVYQMLCAYSARDIERFASCLTADFRFLHAEEESRLQWPDGWTRTDEIESAAHLFSGHVRGGLRLPAAQEIHITYARMLRWDDPARGVNADHYFVEPTELSLFIRFEDGTSTTIDETRQIFRIVRGDVASLPGKARGDASRWYMQRWAEEYLPMAELVRPDHGTTTAQNGGRIEAVCPTPF